MSPPVTYCFDREIAVVRAQDHYSPADLVETVNAALDDPERPAVRGLLLDLRESRSFHGRTPADVEGISRFIEDRRACFGARLGFIPPDRSPARLVQLVSALAEAGGIVAYVFRHPHEARDWLRRSGCAKRTRGPTALSASTTSS